tara:strand:+ start:125 stop:229 length:105 start_codon:yes stop_codon:yes gene_type:complete
MSKRDPTGKEDALGCFTVMLLALIFTILIEVLKR